MESQINGDKNDAESKKKMIGVGELLSSTFEDYKKNFTKVIIFMLIPIAATLVFGIFAALLTGGMLSAKYINGAGTGLAVGLMVGAVVVMVLINVVAMAGIYIIFRYSAENLSTKEIFSRAKKNIGGYLWVSILTGVLVLLWSLLLIVPGIIFGIFYTLSIWAFFMEGKKGMSAVKRSHELIKGFWWPVFGRLALICVIFIVIISIVEKIIPGKGGETVTNIAGWFFGPFAIVYQYHIYKNLVSMKGGGDLATETQGIISKKNKVEGIQEGNEGIGIEGDVLD